MEPTQPEASTSRRMQNAVSPCTALPRLPGASRPGQPIYNEIPCQIGSSFLPKVPAPHVVCVRPVACACVDETLERPEHQQFLRIYWDINVLTECILATFPNHLALLKMTPNTPVRVNFHVLLPTLLPIFGTQACSEFRSSPEITT